MDCGERGGEMTVVKINTNTDHTFERMNMAIDNMTLLESFVAPRATVAERLQAGKALRAQVPRSSHASFQRRPTGRILSASSRRRT